MRLFSLTIVYCVIGLMGLVTARFNIYTFYMLQQKPSSKLATLTGPSSNYNRITLPKENLYSDLSNLQWCDENKEVIFDGKYFEVISMDSSAQQVTLLVIEDEKESKLYKWFFGSYDEEEGKNSEIANDLDIFFLAHSKFKCSSAHAKALVYSAGTAFQYSSGYSGLPETPPRG